MKNNFLNILEEKNRPFNLFFWSVKKLSDEEKEFKSKRKQTIEIIPLEFYLIQLCL